MLHWSQNFRLLVYRFRKKFKTWNINMLHFRLLFKNQKLILWKYNISLTFPWFILWPYSVASIGGSGPPQVTQFWGDTIWGEIYNHNCTDLWWIPCFDLQPYLDQKPISFMAKTFFFFLVFNYFGTENRWHHVIPPRVPPFLATPLVLFPYFFSPSFLGSELHIFT